MIQLNNGIFDFSRIHQYVYTNKDPSPNYLYKKTVNWIQNSVRPELRYSAWRYTTAKDETEQGQMRGTVNGTRQLNIWTLVCFHSQKLNPSCDKGNWIWSTNSHELQNSTCHEKCLL